MKLIKDGDIVDFTNKGTIAAYKSSGYVEYKEPEKKPEQKSQSKK